MHKEWLAAAAQNGFRANEQDSTISGTISNIAFRATVNDTILLELSVNVNDKQLAKMEINLAKETPGLTAVRHNYGILLTLPPQSGTWTPEAFFPVLERLAREAVSYISVSHENTYERYGEPWYTYLRGAAGALLGAMVGSIPWIILGGYGWVSFWLGAIISMASFFGYRLFKGAHSTRFATAVILIFSLLMIFTAEFGSLIIALVQWALESGWQTAWTTFVEVYGEIGFAGMFGNIGIGLIFGIIGLVGIRSQISNYTHEPRFLRRDKRPKN